MSAKPARRSRLASSSGAKLSLAGQREREISARITNHWAHNLYTAIKLASAAPRRLRKLKRVRQLSRQRSWQLAAAQNPFSAAARLHQSSAAAHLRAGSPLERRRQLNRHGRYLSNHVRSSGGRSPPALLWQTTRQANRRGSDGSRKTMTTMTMTMTMTTSKQTQGADAARSTRAPPESR